MLKEENTLNGFRFFRTFLRSGKTTGSIWPSSRFLIRRLLEYADFSKIDTVVEVGPGTGGFTREILKKLPNHGVLLAIEFDESMAESLRSTHDNRLMVHHGSAFDINQIAHTHLNRKPQLIVSSLPLSNFPEECNAFIQDCHNLLADGGLYLQYHYSKKLRTLYSEHFHVVNYGFEWLNIPPAYCYAARKKDESS